MNGKTLLLPLVLSAAFALSACNEQNTAAELPGPIAMTEEAVGHYCNMNILEHTGPKAQIHLKHMQFPVWFSQVRDAIAFMRLPEETLEPVAIYVNDMGKAEQWNFPGDDTWIDINTAYFVIGSRKIGAMGAPEAIPFGSEAKAKSFADQHGGAIARLDEIPDPYVLGPVDLSAQQNQIVGALQ